MKLIMEHLLVSDDCNCTVENEHNLFSDTSMCSPLGFASTSGKNCGVILRSAHRVLLREIQSLCRDVSVEILRSKLKGSDHTATSNNKGSAQT